MKYFIIVLNRNVEAIDWQKFYEPLHHKLVLITSKLSANYLASSPLKSLFHRIFETQNYQAATLLALVKHFIEDEAILATFKQQLVIATNDEQSLLACATVRQQLALAGTTYDELIPFRDKVIMKGKLAHLSNLVPRYLVYEPQKFLYNRDSYLTVIQDYLNYPIFIKPINDGGSRGTHLVYNFQQLSAWCDQATEEVTYELDEFIEGVLFHCDAIINNDRILYYYSSKNAYPCADFSNGKPTASIPLLTTDPDYLALQSLTNLILTALAPVPNGTIHLELFKTPRGEFKFLEIAARSPGCLIPETYYTWQGIDFREAQLKLQLGLAFNPHITPGPFAAWLWYPTKAGIITKFNEPAHLHSHYQLTWRYPIGTLLTAASGLLDYACTLLVSNANYTTLQADFAVLKDYNIYEVAANSQRVTLR